MNGDWKFLAFRADFSPVHTFECGQCFRWNREEEGVYGGIAGSFPARIREEGETVAIQTEAPLSFWRRYFDLDRDYKGLWQAFGDHGFTKEALRFGEGMRI